MTALTDLTPRQVLAVADAALEVAETVGVRVSSVTTSVHAGGSYMTLLTANGDAPALGDALGLTVRDAFVYPDNPTRSIEAFEGDWRGVSLTVQHCIPTVVAS